MVVNDPTGTLLNARKSPKGTIIRKLANETFTWMNVTRINNEFGSNPQPPLPGKLTPLHPDHFHHQGA